MEIKDIKFMNDEVFLLKKTCISLKECTEQIKNIKYEAFYEPYRTEKDDATENTQFPPIVYSFYSFIFYNGKIPNPQELLNNYFNVYSEEFEVGSESIIYNGTKYKKSALTGRILRTYPSLIRDFHFYLMLVEEKCFDKVIYSCKTDIEGKDILIKHKGKEYQVSLFVKTRRSVSYKKLKNTFRHKYENEIQLSLDLNNALKFGDFYVYSQNDIELLKKNIQKLQDNNS